MHRLHEQRQRARPGAVGTNQADPLVIKISTGRGAGHEDADLVAGELLAHTAYDLCPGGIARIGAKAR